MPLSWLSAGFLQLGGGEAETANAGMSVAAARQAGNGQEEFRWPGQLRVPRLTRRG